MRQVLDGDQRPAIIVESLNDLVDRIMTGKELVLQTLDKMPDSAPLAEILERLCLEAAIEEGLADVKAGRTHRHEDVVNYFLHGVPLPEIQSTKPS